MRNRVKIAKFSQCLRGRATPTTPEFHNHIFKFYKFYMWRMVQIRGFSARFSIPEIMVLRSAVAYGAWLGAKPPE
jgi:hypothetical protein